MTTSAGASPLSARELLWTEPSVLKSAQTPWLPPPAGLAEAECAIARHGDVELRLQPSAFDGLGWERAEPALRAGHEYQARHVHLVERTLAAMARYAPSVFEQFGITIRVAALKPRLWGGYDDFSNPELPGSFIASVVDNPLVLADHFIHEFQHNRLSLVEERGALFEVGAPEDGYYSPWRDKPRGLYGVFHGVYVFVAVSRYWGQVFEDADLRPGDRAYALDRLVRIPLQLTLAVDMLQRHAQLTRFGAALLDELALDVDRVRREMAELAVPADTPALSANDAGLYVEERSSDGRRLTARGAIVEHLRLHDQARQCEGLLGEPTLTGVFATPG